MKYTLAIISAALLGGCSEFPGDLTIKANPSGSITFGATIDPPIHPEK